MGWFKQLDRILRGEATRIQDLRNGVINVSAGSQTVVVILLGMFYGLCMGIFAVINQRAGGYLQMIAAIWKVPALFILTLLVTFPSLYVFNALVGSRLTLLSLLRLLVAAVAVMLAVLASFGTILAFFSFTTDSYSFTVLLNVAICSVSGILGLSFLLQTLHRLTLAQEPPASATPADSSASGPLEPVEGRAIGRNVRTVFQLWVIVFALVGAQMSWVLRPFIGSSDHFVLFRPRGSNFFQAILRHIEQLIGR